jgi:hypothetical protein
MLENRFPVRQITLDFGTQAHCVPYPIAARNVSSLEQTGLLKGW